MLHEAVAHPRKKTDNEVSDTISNGKKYVKKIHLGGFNARLHGRRRHVEGVIGNFIFGKTLNRIESKSVDQEILNRDLLVEVARESNLVILSTTKQMQHLYYTVYWVGTKDLKQISQDRFATLDQILCHIW